MIQGFYIGKILIPYYGTMIALGIVVAGIIGYFLIKRFSLIYDDFIILAAYSLGLGIMGAKVLYIYVSRNIIEWKKMLNLEYLNSWMSGGFVFYGGLIAGFIGIVVVWKIHKIDVLSYVKITIPCIPVAHAFGRIGCHLASCCYGIPYSGPICIIYHDSLYAPNNIRLFPVQLLEASLNLFITLILIVFIIKKGSTIYSIYIYLILYAVMRFALEYLRYDYEERGSVGYLSTSQIISILIISVCLISIVINKIRKTFISSRLRGN